MNKIINHKIEIKVHQIVKGNIFSYTPLPADTTATVNP